VNSNHPFQNSGILQRENNLK